MDKTNDLLSKQLSPNMAMTPNNLKGPWRASLLPFPGFPLSFFYNYTLHQKPFPKLKSIVLPPPPVLLLPPSSNQFVLIVSRTALQEEKEERIVVSLSEGNKTFESGLYRALVPSMTTIITSCLRRNELQSSMEVESMRKTRE